MQHDATNRLLSIAGLVTASYGYDALDRRTAKTTGGATTRFLHAGADEIAEYTTAGALLRRYVPRPGADERAAMIDSGLASPPASSIKYPHTDRQGSVMAVTSSTGAVSERFAYDGFGRSTSSASGYPFRYTGQRLDSETGLMFYKARVYSTNLGRFLQTDPIGTKDDLNLYAYVGNDAVNGTDPTGMYDEDIARQQMALQQLANANSDRMLAESWNWLADYHPVGVVQTAVDTVRNPSAESVGWGAFEVAAGKFVRWGEAAFDGVKAGYKTLTNVCCFAAGTLVATKDGLRPIEQIQVGDLVLSRHEETGETAYKAVTALAPTHERVIWTVTLSILSSKPDWAPKEVVYHTTDDHPWRLATGVWVETSQLGRGMRIMRADGEAADIISVFNTGKARHVHNIEVADFHTYFVGEERAWVHNWCPILGNAQKAGPGHAFGSNRLAAEAAKRADSVRVHRNQTLPMGGSIAGYGPMSRACVPMVG